ncbi:unnamed protein product, partial [Closterium sp. NIES-64]
MTALDADDEDNPYDVAYLAEDECDTDSDDEVEYPDEDEEEGAWGGVILDLAAALTRPECKEWTLFLHQHACVVKVQQLFFKGSPPKKQLITPLSSARFAKQGAGPFANRTISTGYGIGALTTVGNPCAWAFDVNSVLRRAWEWYRAEDIDTGRTTSTRGEEMGGYAEHFHPASALALPWPDCGQRGNSRAQGPDEPACEEDPVPEDAGEDADGADDGEGEPGIHVRTGFYRNRHASSYRIGGIMLLHWARLFAVTLRVGIYTSNATESNSAVYGIRMLPPTWLLASLWDCSRDK